MKATAKQVNVSFLDSAAMVACCVTVIDAIAFLECLLPKAPNRAKVEIKQASNTLRTMAFIVVLLIKITNLVSNIQAKS